MENVIKKPVWGFWATLGFGLLIGVIWIAFQSVAAIVVGKKLGLSFNELEFNGLALAIATIVSAFVAILLIFVFVKIREGANLQEYLAFKPISRKTLLAILGLMVVFMAMMEFLSRFLEKDIVPEFMLEATQSIGWLPLLWFAVIIAAPLVEEIFFRGFLLEGFRHSFMGNAGAIVLTSLLWAVIHLQYGLFEISLIFAMGLLFGYIRLKTGSIWSPIIMHAFNNLVSTIMVSWYLSTQPV